MIHKKIEIKSGNVRLRKMTKTQARVAIRDHGRFHGFICGNRVNPAHIADGWHLGMRIDANDVKLFDTQAADFETSLVIYTPELGQYPHFYQIIDEA
jgi:hypothetical protein